MAAVLKKSVDLLCISFKIQEDIRYLFILQIKLLFGRIIIDNHYEIQSTLHLEEEILNI